MPIKIQLNTGVNTESETIHFAHKFRIHTVNERSGDIYLFLFVVGRD